jgi:hypothetical protein
MSDSLKLEVTYNKNSLHQVKALTENINFEFKTENELRSKLREAVLKIYPKNRPPKKILVQKTEEF